MSKNWPMVKLGDVLTPISRPVDVQADEPYRQIGIRSDGKGVFHQSLPLGNSSPTHPWASSGVEPVRPSRNQMHSAEAK